MADVLLVLNDNLIQILNVTNESTGVTIDAATVTATLKDLSDVNITGQSWPVTFTAKGSGIYHATIESAVSITANTDYKLVWDIVDGALVAHGETIIPAEVRRG